MEGLKEALEYAVGLSEPHKIERNGELFTDKPMERVHQLQPKASPLELSTLTSLLNYIESNTDIMPGHMLIHIKSPTEVQLMSELDVDRRREILATVNARVPRFEYGCYYSSESFVINLMANFVSVPSGTQVLKKNDLDLVLKFAGTVETGTIAQYGDDGVSQKATIQQTCTSREDVIVPNPVSLIPYRTFKEIDQPASKFVFRMKEGGHGPQMALFDSDGGAWEVAAMQAIHEYLYRGISKIEKDIDTVFTILS